MPIRVPAPQRNGRPSSAERPAPGIDVVLVDLSADDRAVTRAEALLSPAELSRARRGTPDVHRRRALLRAALRLALGNELGIDPRAVPLGTTPTGRPVVAPTPGRPPVDASCSASGTLGVVAVGRDCRIGIDVEAVPPWSPDVLEEPWLSGSERSALARLPLADRSRAVTRCWTQKEAVLKARGTGLAEDPVRTVTPVGQAGCVVDGWQLLDVDVPEGWLASLAVTPEERPR